jgi:hypothetical protein
MVTQTFLPLAPTVSVGLTGMKMIRELPKIPLSVLLGVSFVDRGGGGGGWKIIYQPGWLMGFVKHHHEPIQHLSYSFLLV